MKLRNLPSSGPGAGQMYGEGVEGLWGSIEKKSSLVGDRAAAEPLKEGSSSSMAYFGTHNRKG